MVYEFNCKYLVVHGLKMHLLVMGVIEKPADIVLFYKYRNFLSVGGDSSIRSKYVSRFPITCLLYWFVRYFDAKEGATDGGNFICSCWNFIY